MIESYIEEGAQPSEMEMENPSQIHVSDGQTPKINLRFSRNEQPTVKWCSITFNKTSIKEYTYNYPQPSAFVVGNCLSSI